MVGRSNSPEGAEWVSRIFTDSETQTPSWDMVKHSVHRRVHQIRAKLLELGNGV